LSIRQPKAEFIGKHITVTVSLGHFAGLFPNSSMSGEQYGRLPAVTFLRTREILGALETSATSL